MDLNSIYMFLEYDWLVKHNLEVNWNMRTIQFTKDIKSRTKRIQPMDNQDKEHQEIGKEIGLTNPEYISEYI